MFIWLQKTSLAFRSSEKKNILFILEQFQIYRIVKIVQSSCILHTQFSLLLIS